MVSDQSESIRYHVISDRFGLDQCRILHRFDASLEVTPVDLVGGDVVGGDVAQGDVVRGDVVRGDVV